MTGQNEIELDLHGIQAVSFDIMVAFNEYCKKHGLHLYLCGGTLLGAVRHGGFIPWDDDVDTFLSRPDYERLKELVKTDPIREDLKLACIENGGFYRPFIRIYNTNTTVHRENMKDESMPHVWLDVLPVDGMTADLKKAARRYYIRRRLNLCNSISMWRFGKAPNARLLLIRTLLWPIARLMGPRFWARSLERLATHYPFETSDHVACIAFGKYGVGEIMPKDGFLKPVPMTFEGREFETMSCWEIYLTGIYHDYMQLPPEEKRHAPHPKYAGIRTDAFERIRREYADILDKE